MRKLALAMVVLCASTLALAAEKEPPKWSYIEAGYIDFSPDGDAPSDDGWYAGGSAGLFKHFHIFAEYDDVGDFTFWNAGFGWHGLLGEPADLYFQAQWNDVSVDSPGGDVDDDGYEVGAGVRWKVIKWLEVKGQVNWSDYSDAGDDVTGEAGVLFTFLGDKIGVGATYEVQNFGDQARAYFRWNIGR